MTLRSNRSLAILVGIFAALAFSIVAGGATVAAVGLQEIPALLVAWSTAPAEGPPSDQANTCTVTSLADSGPGTLRICLENALNDDLIDFDTSVFPPISPMTITLTSGLPNLDDGNVTIDASNAGVVLDGSQVGSIPEIVLLDDVNLTVDGGPNLIANDDFTSGSGHWRPWTDGSDVVRSITTSDFHSSPNSYEWSVLAHSGDPRTVYDATDTSDPIDGYPLPISSTVWLSATGGSTVEMSFWFRYGPIGVDLWILYADGNEEWVGDWWYAETDWTPATFNTTLPDDTVGIALVFNHAHSERHVRGLQIISGGNTIQGLQVVNFPGTGVGLSGNDNIVGGNRDIGSGPMGQGNLISGNGQWGVVVEGASGNTISGNYIGTNISGTAAFSNAWMGVTLHQGAQHNLVGGDSEGEGNLISGNGTDGVWILNSGTDYNTVSGNFIGTDIDGMAAIPNDGFGVFVRDGAQYNTIGGDTPQERNLVSGNGNCGVILMDEGTDHNVVSGNYIGTDVNGTAAIPNPTCGVGLWGQPKYNIIGGSNTTPGGACSGACNLISGNSDETWAVGVGIGGPGTDHNVVIGNYIGTDPSGTIAVPNGGSPTTAPGLGVSIADGAIYNTIGGDTPKERNLISGNTGGAVGIDSSHNVAIGNYMGVDVTGLVALGNGGGVGISGAYNRVGGSTPGERNIISGNKGGAVFIENSGTMSNTLTGNYIGTDIYGTAAIPNGWGVQIWNGAQRNTVGGSAPGEGNLISGNSGDGIIIQDNETFTNTVSGNYIGTSADGNTALANDGYGIHIHSAASHNVIGGDASGQGNLISGNASGGVGIGNGNSNYNLVSGNYVGTDASGTVAIPNGGDGVSLWWNASWNTVGISNVIAFNAGHGVHVDGAGTVYNTITRNSIHSNTNQGIALSDGGNGHLSAPTVAAFDPGSGTASGTALPGCTVEVYSDAGDEGRWFEGEAVADGGGHWAFSRGSAFFGSYVQATCTDTTGNTSEFSPGLQSTCPLVSSSGDSGPGTLRDCLERAVAGNTITFDPALFLPGSPVSITLASGLPAITQGNLTIDGSTAGVIVDGSAAGSGVDGLVITSDSNAIKGMQILNFSGNGITIGGGASHNLIGGVNTTPGVGCSGDCNLISGNGNDGVIIAYADTRYNTISGNYIGLDASGSVALPNGADGIIIEGGASHNLIGGDTPGERNLIGGNGDEGIRIRSGSDGNTIQGNYIGMDASGTIPIGNAYYGIEISSGYNIIGGNNASPGGACSGECNLVSGNTYGIQIVGSNTLYRDRRQRHDGHPLSCLGSQQQPPDRRRP